MSDQDSSVSRTPSPDRECRDRDGYHTCFYPGFVRKVVVRQDGAEIVLYEQEAPFVLPDGETEPWPSSEFELSGGPNRQDVRLRIDDPLHRIARIEVVFRPAGDGGTEDGGEESVTIFDAPVICPPNC